MRVIYCNVEGWIVHMVLPSRRLHRSRLPCVRISSRFF